MYIYIYIILKGSCQTDTQSYWNWYDIRGTPESICMPPSSVRRTFFPDSPAAPNQSILSTGPSVLPFEWAHGHWFQKCLDSLGRPCQRTTSSLFRRTILQRVCFRSPGSSSTRKMSIAKKPVWAPPSWAWEGFPIDIQVALPPIAEKQIWKLSCSSLVVNCLQIKR